MFGEDSETVIFSLSRGLPVASFIEVNVTFEWRTNTGVIEASIGLRSVVRSHVAGCSYGYGCHRSSFLLLTRAECKRIAASEVPV